MLLTKEIKNKVRTANAVCFDFETPYGLESYERDKRIVTIRVSHDANGKRGEARTLFEGFEGRVRCGYKDETATHTHDGRTWKDYSKDARNLYLPMSGCWVFSSASCQDTLQTAFRCAPTGSTLKFEALLDYGTHLGCVERALHVDYLDMIAEPPAAKNGKRAQPLTFRLDVDCMPHNTARFGMRMGVDTNHYKSRNALGQ